MAGEARNRAFDSYQDGARLLFAPPSPIWIMAGAAWSAVRQFGELVVAVRLFVVITIGELYLSPSGYRSFRKIAPARMISTTMGLWLAQLHRQFRCRLARQLLELNGRDFERYAQPSRLRSPRHDPHHAQTLGTRPGH